METYVWKIKKNTKCLLIARLERINAGDKNKGEMRHGDLSKEVMVIHVDYANKISVEGVVREHFPCFQEAQVDRTGNKAKCVIGRLL